MGAIALTLATGGFVYADEAVSVAEQITALDAKYEAATQYIWVLVAAALVMFMQAGFAMVEAGFCRAKNATNLMAKNLMDFTMGSLVFFAVGYSLLKGTDVGGIIGIRVKRLGIDWRRRRVRCNTPGRLRRRSGLGAH